MIYFKNTVKFIYISIVSIMFILAIYVLITNNNPIYYFDNIKYTDAKPFELSNYNWIESDSTLITSDGNIQIHSTDKSIGSNFYGETDKGLFIILYNFESKIDNSRPYAIWNKYITATQDGKELYEGTLNKENESSRYGDFLNNSVSFYNKDKSTEAANIYSYDLNGGPIIVKYGDHSVTYKIK